MKLKQFEKAVIELAGEGTEITVANVVARLKVDPDKAEKWLDQLAKDGRLDLELDENEGAVFYRVRGLTVRTGPARRGGLTPPSDAAALGAGGWSAPRGGPLPKSLRKSTLLGAVLGLVFPGVGLAYAAPATAVIVISLVGWIAIWLLAHFPLLGGFLSHLAIAAFALGSAGLGALYTAQFNQNGRRTALKEAPEKHKRLTG